MGDCTVDHGQLAIKKAVFPSHPGHKAIVDSGRSFFLHIVFHLNVCCAERTKILCGRVFLIDLRRFAYRASSDTPQRGHPAGDPADSRSACSTPVPAANLKHTFQMDCLISQRQFKLFRVCLVQFDQLRQQTVLKALLKLALSGCWIKKHLRSLYLPQKKSQSLSKYRQKA